MGTMIKEQALIVQTVKGIVLITGCSHPGIADMATRAAQLFPDENFFLVTGGFHLGGNGRRKINSIIDAFRKLNIQHVGPSHCTGKKAREMFKEEWGEDFLELGCGATLTIPQGDDGG